MSCKCDVIIPVYNAPEYVNFCVYALIKNTKKELLGKIYLLDDCSNNITRNLIDNLKEKYSDVIEVVHNKNNLGFIKNVNNGFKISHEQYVMLLNTDCFVAKNTVGKLMKHMENNKKIGLICPACSNAANLTLPIFDGYSYMMMDELLERKFESQNFDACTVVGNCLMISRDCINKVGGLDEIYGMGYGDETDYQFKAMAKGFEAKVAIDTYVFHKAEMSFNTTNKKRSERLEKNRKIFFDRWGEEYNKLLKEYSKNDPIEYINNNLTLKDLKVNYDYCFVLPQMGKGTGGVIIINELTNYLNLLGYKVGMVNLYPGHYDEIQTFKPIAPEDINRLSSKYLIATIYDSVFFAEKLAQKIGSKVIYFSQGYEFLFNNGRTYEEVEISFKLPDYVLTISNYLKDRYKLLFGIDSAVALNGINYDLIHKNSLEKNKNSKKKIIMNIRNEVLKGGCFLNDLVKLITVEINNVEIHIINNTCDFTFPINNNETDEIIIHNGPIPKIKMIELLQDANILVDASLSEGFGLLPLEAMACGTVPVVSDSFGNREYCVNEKNSYIIKEAHDTSKYLEKIKELLSNDKLYSAMQKEAIKTAKKFDFTDAVEKYAEVLKEIDKGKYQKNKFELSKNDLDVISNYTLSNYAYRHIINCSINMFRNEQNSSHQIRRSNRIPNFIRIFKEFIKANLFLLKLTIKTIFNKDFRIWKRSQL